MENSSYHLIYEMIVKPEDREKAKIRNEYKASLSTRNEYKASVNGAAVNLVMKDSCPILQRGI